MLIRSRRISLVILGLLILLAAPLASASRARAQSSAVQIPTVPDPVPVTLDPSTTTFLALDFLTSNCSETSRPACVASLPPVNSAIAAARAVSVPIVYSLFTGGTLRPEMTPGPSDVQLETMGADKFFNTNLDDMLKQHGTTTVIITGTSSNGAVLYTGVEAAIRGYTVVIAEDGISGSTPFADFYTVWHSLFAPGTTNPDNTPLAPKAITLSRTNLISYGSASATSVQSTGAGRPPVQMPTIPDPAAVSLDASTTAFLALDLVPSLCSLQNANRAPCVATLPVVASGIGAARAAHVPVIYTGFANTSPVPEVAAGPNDPYVLSTSGDKFFNTNLDDILKQQGITTLVITGTVTDSAVLMTSFEASTRGYTVVVAEDGVSSTTDFANVATLWQLLNGPGTSNPQNAPLQPKAVTLSRTDLITYR